MDRTTGTSAPQERSVADWLRALREAWWIIAVCVALGLGAGALVTRSQPVEFESTGTLVLSPARGFLDPENSDVVVTSSAKTVTRLVDTPSVLVSVRDRYLASSPGADLYRRSNVTTLDWLDDHIAAEQLPQSSIVRITAHAPTSADSEDLSRATVHVVKETVQGDHSAGEAAGLRARIFSVAESKGQVSPTDTRNLLIGGNAGLIIGLTVALLLGMRWRRARRPGDVEETLGLPVLGVVHRSRKRPLAQDPGIAEVRARLAHTRPLDRSQTVLVSGPTSSERIAEVAQALVGSLSATSARAVLVDADLTTSASSRMLSVADRPGLSDALRLTPLGAPAPSDVSPEGAQSVTSLVVRPAERELDEQGPALLAPVLPAGARLDDPGVALNAGNLQRTLDALRFESDAVVIAGPSLERRADILTLAMAVDHVVLLVESRVMLRKLAGMLALGAPLDERIAGVVLVERSPWRR